ncbi:MAG TPA: CinA family nicotinamide mononucleotide deamidase-related protein, partial [Acidimicrobiales bacterium]|nr:CinA family nicotinamide mononucleotide deamidase-related protein [Acidimicrobiales bacterium]
MRCEVVAVGTELLLGQIVDSNSAWIGARLAEAGIDSHFQVKVGDNLERIVAALRTALDRSDAVICCGGLGPTQDDITREAIAQALGVPLERDEAMVATIQAIFTGRGRPFPPSNARQAERPAGASFLAQTLGTAPGLSCPVGDKVVYAVPGVPHEMKDMVERAVLPDLAARAGEPATIRSRTLRTWGLAESALAELLAARMEQLDDDPSGPTIAFLASGMEGIKVRVTVKAPTQAEAVAALGAEEQLLRGLLGELVFGVDDETMESVVGQLLGRRGWTLALAESMTGGMVSSRIVDTPEASTWFKGGVVTYATEVKFGVLGVREGPVVCEECAVQMAEGVRRLLDTDVGLS